MQRAFDGGSSVSARFIHVTPRLLRKIADKIEESSKGNSTNEATTIEFTNGVIFYYEPALDGQLPQAVKDISVLSEIDH